MSSSPPIQLSLSPTHSSKEKHSNMTYSECDVEIENKRSNLRLSRGHALLRRQLSRSIILQPQRTYKRRFTFPGCQEQKVVFKKRRRFTSVALPTKFLLGGNINDPLNLRSLENDKVNQQFNSFTPASSPMPISRQRTQVQVLIPPNIYDPLNLNTGEEIEFSLLTSKHRKRRRHRKNHRDDMDNEIHGMHVITIRSIPPINPEVPVHRQSDAYPQIEMNSNPPTAEQPISDKIVSPQGLLTKLIKRQHSNSFSKAVDEKRCSQQLIRRHMSKTGLQRKVDYTQYKMNAGKFPYGNHIVRSINLKDDQRLHILNKVLFFEKDVLDIGSNSGELTIYIAKHLGPSKIVGIDIDKKLVDIAQRKVCRYISSNISEEIDFPECMTSFYGPLSKVLVLNRTFLSKFPNNVTFFEVNYVPECEEILENQKPEFNIILCLRVTKWIHLNFGDDGLKLAFKRMYAQLRYGGYLILEPQPWFMYSKSKRITPTMYETYTSLQMRPEMFCQFLLSEVGFSSCELIGRVYNSTKVYQQPLYLLTKGFRTSYHQNNQMDVLPFHSDQWSHNSNEQGACSTWSDAEYLENYSDT